MLSNVFYLSIKIYLSMCAIDRYYDRYRDTKDLNEEVLKIKLGMISPYEPYTPKLKYPLAHINFGKPTWLRRRLDLVNRRQEQFEYLPKWAYITGNGGHYCVKKWTKWTCLARNSEIQSSSIVDSAEQVTILRSWFLGHGVAENKCEDMTLT
jgi:hypothetical protein